MVLLLREEQGVARNPTGWERRALAPVLPGVDLEFMRTTIRPRGDVGALSPRPPGSRQYVAVERGTRRLAVAGERGGEGMDIPERTDATDDAASPVETGTGRNGSAWDIDEFRRLGRRGVDEGSEVAGARCAGAASPGDRSAMRPPLRVEPATSADAALVHRITVAGFDEYRETLDPPSGALAETVPEVARAIVDGGAALVWDGAEAVGSVRFDRHPDHLYVGRLAVLPAYRRRGVGAALMRFAEEEARRLGLPEIRLEVRAALPGNVAFFRGLGYAVRDVQPHPRQPAAQVFTLAKPVRPSPAPNGG